MGVIVTGMATGIERLTLDYWRAVQRVRRMAVPEADKASVLADVEATYRREACRLRDSVQIPYIRPVPRLSL